jgi:L,D-peptidoglycan transpeptidase YkuD (ErfK/YbiS/YcfS/YnhG family)
VLNYNIKPIIKNKGSAIFIHIAKKNYKQTFGCIGLKKKNLLFLLKNLKKKTKIKIE